jgi:hypothetical protein
MQTNQRENIGSPAQGLLVFDTALNGHSPGQQSNGPGYSF